MLKQMLKARRLMKDKFWKAKQDYLKFYEELPIDEKAILLESEHGKKMDGNIFYLVRYLATSEKYKDYTVYLSSMCEDHFGKVRKIDIMHLDSEYCTHCRLDNLWIEHIYRVFCSKNSLYTKPICYSKNCSKVTGIPDCIQSQKKSTFLKKMCQIIG